MLNDDQKKVFTAFRDIYKQGRLVARPTTQPIEKNFIYGVQKLDLGYKKEGLVYIPETYQAGFPSSLAIMLHGSGGDADQGLSLLRNYADEENIILLAPVSKDYSWDIIASRSFGPDVIYIDQALSYIFENYTIDPSRLAIGGFSDGASYALSLGLNNGDLFTHILAFFPGFSYSPKPTGKPKIFISHGINDLVLPIDSSSREIIKQLETKGVQPRYIEFNGGHEIPLDIYNDAIDWFKK